MKRFEHAPSVQSNVTYTAHAMQAVMSRNNAPSLSRCIFVQFKRSRVRIFIILLQDFTATFAVETRC